MTELCLKVYSVSANLTQTHDRTNSVVIHIEIPDAYSQPFKKMHNSILKIIGREQQDTVIGIIPVEIKLLPSNI